MNRDAAVLKLYDLGCSREEIDDLIRIEALRRKAEQNARKREAIVEIVKDMEL